jgi:CheY-like chemotaxis protein
MPVMNGYDATIQIRNFEQKEGLRHTPIIALTAADNLDTKSHCLSVGMYEHIQTKSQLQS